MAVNRVLKAFRKLPYAQIQNEFFLLAAIYKVGADFFTKLLHKVYHLRTRVPLTTLRQMDTRERSIAFADCVASQLSYPLFTKNYSWDSDHPMSNTVGSVIKNDFHLFNTGTGNINSGIFFTWHFVPAALFDIITPIP